MRFFRFLCVALLSCWAGLSQAAGFTFIEVPASQGQPALRGAVWTPCNKAAGQIALGPMRIDGSEDCAIAGTQLPLIVFSHGSGGSFLGHHDTAAALADAGFVVAAINHPGDNFQDLSRQGSLSVFLTRPNDLTRLVDYLLGAWPGRSQLDADRIGVFGFSRGGFTGLVAAGGKPQWRMFTDLCPAASPVPLCTDIANGALPPMPENDSRIRAAVIVDPLPVFNRDGLSQLHVPIQLWASAQGGDGVTLERVTALRDALPVAPDWHVATGAGHFAFLAPCSAAMAEMAPEICRDGPGFDRTSFHRDFNAKVSAFFQRHLKRGGQ
ncbi:dienelactone hydrolase [Pigmentiphaga aceris]|uniref:Dienelactone hydrolase n=1 Tax=Pigmentiphaga aceris TaxID=1940612 RepID=A0A5C0AWS3_9BURK|nr:dienelactone hydrolase [Pigmentiphaga aceris]QEI06912.1 dienelactone hydrolase [Pigmentiphaga aceris]